MIDKIALGGKFFKIMTKIENYFLCDSLTEMFHCVFKFIFL